jgi:hypothetical protein
MKDFKNTKTAQFIKERWGHLDATSVEQYFKDKSDAFHSDLTETARKVNRNKELVDEIYTLNRQNNTEKTDFDIAFKSGIEITVEELVEHHLGTTMNKLNTKIKELEELLAKTKSGFHADEEWWDCGNYDDAHEHGVIEGYIEGLERTINLLKQD